MEPKETNQPFQIKLLSETTEYWWGGGEREAAAEKRYVEGGHIMSYKL